MNTFFTGDILSVRNHIIIIQCYDNTTLLRSAEVTRSFTILPSPFEEITANITKVKALHIIDLRIAVNHIQNYYNMNQHTWANDIISGKTQIRDWVYHIKETRVVVDNVVNFINDFNDNTIPQVNWLSLDNGRPKADVMNQLYSLILTV